MNAYKLFLAVVFLIVSSIFFLVFFQAKTKFSNYSAKNFKEISKSSQFPAQNSVFEQENLPIKFYFRMHLRTWLKPNIKTLPTTVKVSSNIPENWIILNFLNFWYPDWKNYFSINSETLKKKISLKNYVTYQPLLTSIQKKVRFALTLEDLAEINITASDLEIEEEQFLSFFHFLKDEKNDLASIKAKIPFFIGQSKVNSVTKKIEKGIAFF